MGGWTKDEQGLTEKQRRFADEYLIDLNATQAALRAGYSENGAGVQGSELLKNPYVSAYLTEKKEIFKHKLDLSAEKVLRELMLLGFSNMMDYVRVQPCGDAVIDLSSLSRDQAAAITEITVDEYKPVPGEEGREVKRVKFKLADKRASLTDLGKHLGLFKDTLDVNLTDVAQTILAARNRSKNDAKS